jgi:hypothetical protein
MHLFAIVANATVSLIDPLGQSGSPTGKDDEARWHWKDGAYELHAPHCQGFPDEGGTSGVYQQYFQDWMLPRLFNLPEWFRRTLAFDFVDALGMVAGPMRALAPSSHGHWVGPTLRAAIAA